MMRRRCASSTKVDFDSSILPVALDVDPVGPVDHDLADRVLPKQRLERPVAEDVVGDLADDLPALVPRERRLVERELLGDDAQDAVGQVLVRRLEKSSGPSFAMHAWWIRVFSSA